MSSSSASGSSEPSSASWEPDSTDRGPFLISVSGYGIVNNATDPEPDFAVTQMLKNGKTNRTEQLNLGPVCAILDMDDYDEAQSQLRAYLSRHLREPLSLDSNLHRIHDLPANTADDITINSLTVFWDKMSDRTVISQNNWNAVAQTLQKRKLVDRMEVDIQIDRFEDQNVGSPSE